MSTHSFSNQVIVAFRSIAQECIRPVSGHSFCIYVVAVVVVDVVQGV